MANLHRNDTISVVNGSFISPGAGFFVNAYAPGAICRAATSGSGTTTVPVYDGSIIVADEFLMLGLDTTKVYKVITGTAGVSGSQTVVLDGTIGTIDPGDVLINLGKDIGSQGSGPPSFTQNGTANAVIYTTPDTSAPITNSIVTCDSSGDYDYFYAVATNIWELVRNTAGTPIAYFLLNTAGLRSSTTSTDNDVVRWDGATGLIIQDGYTSNPVSISDAGAITAAGAHSLGSITTTTSAVVGTTLTVNGNATLGDTTGDTVTITGPATVGAGLTVTGTTALAVTTVSSTLAVTGLSTLTGGVKTAHIDASLGNTPSAAITSGWGTTGSPTVSISGTDTRFTATVTSGTGTPANPAIFAVTFASAYSATPHVMVVQNVLSGGGAVSTGGLRWVASTSGIAISMLMAPATTTVYTFEVYVIA